MVDPKARDTITIGNALFVADWLKENDNMGNRASITLRGVLVLQGMYPKTYLVVSGRRERGVRKIRPGSKWIMAEPGDFSFPTGAGYFTMCTWKVVKLKLKVPKQ